MGGVSDAVAGGFDWEPKLPLYQLSGIQATELDAICSFATDKAWVGGLPLQYPAPETSGTRAPVLDA